MSRIGLITFLATSLLFSSCDCMQFVVGTVIDDETKEPIPGVRVYKLGTENFDTTDEQGEFEIRSISGGLFRCPTMKIVVEKEGYESVRHKGGGQVELKKESN